MCLKVLIFRRNALIYIKAVHIFHWPTFSPPHSLPQVHISRAEELYRPLPTCASQASGPARPLCEGPVDSRVEGLQGWGAGQTLWTVFQTLSHPWNPSGNYSAVSYHLWNCGRYICTECHHLNHLTDMRNRELEGLFIQKNCKYYVLVYILLYPSSWFLKCNQWKILFPSDLWKIINCCDEFNL